MTITPEISIIIPIHNEAESLSTLFNRLSKELNSLRKTYEIIFIDDGSIDKSFDELIQIHKKHKQKTNIIKFRKNLGKGMALKAGFGKAQGKYVITIDADLQDDPKEIKKILKVLENGSDVVSGWKRRRKDPLSKKYFSYIFNLIVSLMMNHRIHDINCGLKGYKREVVKEIEICGDRYRFLPLLAKKAGFMIAEVTVRHHPRKFGKSKYGWKRILSGSVDLFTILFITNFQDKPAHFFGLIGLTIFVAGVSANMYVTFLKISTGTTQGHIPLLLFGILMIIVGIQIISLGLLGELLVPMSNKKGYHIVYSTFND